MCMWGKGGVVIPETRRSVKRTYTHTYIHIHTHTCTYNTDTSRPARKTICVCERMQERERDNLTYIQKEETSDGEVRGVYVWRVRTGTSIARKWKRETHSHIYRHGRAAECPV